MRTAWVQQNLPRMNSDVVGTVQYMARGACDMSARLAPGWRPDPQNRPSMKKEDVALQDSVINGALAVDGERLRASGGGRVLSP